MPKQHVELNRRHRYTMFTLYAIRHIPSKELLGFTVTQSPDDGVRTTLALTSHKNIWTTHSLECAEKAIASVDIMCPFDRAEMEIVTLEYLISEDKGKKESREQWVARLRKTILTTLDSHR